MYGIYKIEEMQRQQRSGDPKVSKRSKVVEIRYSKTHTNTPSTSGRDSPIIHNTPIRSFSSLGLPKSLKIQIHTIHQNGLCYSIILVTTFHQDLQITGVILTLLLHFIVHVSVIFVSVIFVSTIGSSTVGDVLA